MYAHTCYSAVKLLEINLGQIGKHLASRQAFLDNLFFMNALRIDVLHFFRTQQVLGLHVAPQHMSYV